MTDIHFDVVAIGNAIVDVIGRCDDAFLDRHGASKGHMRLVELDELQRIYADMGPAVEISGGSAANTVTGLAALGGRAAFIGKVADDDFGAVFGHDIRAAGVHFATPASNSRTPTARSLILVTPDGERTMNTYLGVSPEFTDAEVAPDLIRGGKVTYLEGYLFDRPAAKEAFRKAAQVAKQAGREVALTLSDGFCVARHRDEFRDLIRGEIDILFANEDEITSLYQTASVDLAIAQARTDAVLAVVTRSEKGCVVLSSNDILAVPAFPVGQVVDTTGAGDLFAAGFLFGYTRSMPMEACARLGAMAAAEIISHIGARPEADLAEMARRNGLLSN